MMFPNTNFLRFFPEAALPEEAEEPERSSCLHVGAYFVLRKVINESYDEITAFLSGQSDSDEK